MPYMVQGLITIAEETVNLTNSSTTGLNPDGTTLGGFTTLIESLGSAGVIVAFGGITNVPGRPMQLVCIIYLTMCQSRNYLKLKEIHGREGQSSSACLQNQSSPLS